MAKTNNLAFDYAVYDEQELARSRKIKHRLNAEAGNKRITTVGIISLALVALVIMCSMIYGQVELSSLYAQQSQMRNELALLNDENISLKSEIDSKTGLVKVEEYAEKELGLQKLDKSQIEYVEVEKETIAEVIDTDNTNVFVKITRWFSDVLEYIGL